MSPPVCHAAPEYWNCYNALPESIRDHANRSFELLKSDPGHPLLQLRKIDRLWSARVGLQYRALAAEAPDGLVWFWVGTHAGYDRLIG